MVPDNNQHVTDAGIRRLFCGDCGGTAYIAHADLSDVRCANCEATIHVPEGYVVSVSGKDAQEVLLVADALADSMAGHATNGRKNPWISGSFYLSAVLVLLVVLFVVVNTVHLVVLPVVIAGALILVSAVGAFTLRQDAALSEKNFIKLMGLTFRQLPLLNMLGKKANDNE